MTAHIAPTLEALRVRRDAYAASGGEAAVIYDKLRDELVLARQYLSDQEKWLATARLDPRAASRTLGYSGDRPTRRRRMPRRFQPGCW